MDTIILSKDKTTVDITPNIPARTISVENMVSNINSQKSFLQKQIDDLDAQLKVLTDGGVDLTAVQKSIDAKAQLSQPPLKQPAEFLQAQVDQVIK